MSWDDYVQACQGLGFSKVTIIKRSNYNVLASTQGDVATAYMDGDTKINENQELLDDWKDKKRSVFRFYQKKFNVVQRDEEEGSWIVAAKQQEVVIAYQFKDVWFLVYGNVGKKADEKASNTQLQTIPAALDAVMKNVWDPLKDTGL